MQYNFHPEGAKTIGVFTPDNLIADGFQGVTKAIKLKAGAVYKRGTVLQESVAPGIYEPVAADAKAVYILLEDRDLTNAVGDKPGMVAMTGAFNKRALTLGAGATLAGITPVLEARNIYLRDSIAVELAQ